MPSQGPPSFRNWVEDRADWTALRARWARRQVRGDTAVPYLGGALVFLLLLQVATGVLLMLHYQPSVAEAHRSVAFVVGGLPYGDLVRNMHLWAGDLVILGVAAQIFGAVLRRAFRTPNELVWVTGLLVLGTVLALAFTGVVLPWSQSAYLQARVGSELVGQAPFIGGGLRYLLRGGEEVTTATLRHAYGFHVAVLPATLTVLVAVHAAFLRGGAALRNAEAPDRTIPLYPDFLLRLAAVITGTLVLVLSLATFVPRTLDVAADPSAPALHGAQPPWYFLFLHQLLLLAPKELLGVRSPTFLVGAGMVLIGLAFALPFFDRKGSRLTLAIATGLLVLVLLLSAHAIF